MAKRVLILDDDADFNNLLTDIYGQADYDVSSERDPEVAISLVAETDFDIVVTDQKMPGLSGEEFIREVKAMKPDLPIIMVSGYLDNDTIRRLIKEGVGGVFLKPLNVFSLLKRTAALIEEREMGMRRKSQADAENTDPEPEHFQHNLPFPFKSFPCRSKNALEFAQRLYSLRNFKSNLIIIAPPGSDLDSVIDDLEGFDDSGQEAFLKTDLEQLTEANLLQMLEDASNSGGARITVAVREADQMNSRQKKVIFAAASKDAPFDPLALPLRFIFHVSRDLDDLYDAGHIDDDLYMFMGTSEIHIPALSDVREDVALLAHRYLKAECEQRGLERTPSLDGPVRAYLRDLDLEGNALALRRLMALAIDQGSSVITREDLSAISERLHAATRGRALDLRHEIENYRADLCSAMLHFCHGNTQMAARFLAVPEPVVMQAARLEGITE